MKKAKPHITIISLNILHSVHSPIQEWLPQNVRVLLICLQEPCRRGPACNGIVNCRTVQLILRARQLVTLTVLSKLSCCTCLLVMQHWPEPRQAGAAGRPVHAPVTLQVQPWTRAGEGAAGGSSNRAASHQGSAGFGWSFHHTAAPVRTHAPQDCIKGRARARREQCRPCVIVHRPCCCVHAQLWLYKYRYILGLLELLAIGGDCHVCLVLCLSLEVFRLSH